MIEGFGSEVYYGLIIGLLIFIISFIILKRAFGHPDREELRDGPEESRPPRIYNPNYCPICLGVQSFALETNCGHLYCGFCLHRHYVITGNDNSTGIVCSMCRQRVVLIFNCFTPEEWQGPLDSDSQETRDTVLQFARMYNRVVRTDLTLTERILELPVLIRHFFDDTFHGGRAEPHHLRLRLLILMVMTILYILLPFDIFPEFIYGIYGYSDDVLLFIIMTGHVLIVYRNFIANA